MAIPRFPAGITGPASILGQSHPIPPIGYQAFAPVVLVLRVVRVVLTTKRGPGDVARPFVPTLPPFFVLRAWHSIPDVNGPCRLAKDSGRSSGGMQPPVG